jgi:hypothetical protein
MHSAEFEPAFPASDRPQTQAVKRADTGICINMKSKWGRCGPGYERVACYVGIYDKILLVSNKTGCATLRFGAVTLLNIVVIFTILSA